MEYEQLKRLISESYPFPIARAHKNTLRVFKSGYPQLMLAVRHLFAPKFGIMRQEKRKY